MNDKQHGLDSGADVTRLNLAGLPPLPVSLDELTARLPLRPEVIPQSAPVGSAVMFGKYTGAFPVSPAEAQRIMSISDGCGSTSFQVMRAAIDRFGSDKAVAGLLHPDLADLRTNPVLNVNRDLGGYASFPLTVKIPGGGPGTEQEQTLFFVITSQAADFLNRSCYDPKLKRVVTSYTEMFNAAIAKHGVTKEMLVSLVGEERTREQDASMKQWQFHGPGYSSPGSDI